MTPPFPFAGATALCDAASSSPLPELMSATSPVAVIRSGDGAFSSRRPRTSRERIGEIEAQVDKIGVMAGKGMTYKEIAEVYDVSSNTISRICARHDIGERIRRELVEPKKVPGITAAPAIGPASMSFVDDAAAIADCGSRYIPRRPDPFSYMGCAAAMCTR
jgi:hypothetical protein